MNALQAEIERICQRIGLSRPIHACSCRTSPWRGFARRALMMSSTTSRGGAISRTSPFTVGRFVLMSSKESVGGGPYIVEEAFPLHEARSSSVFSSSDLHPVKSMV